VPPTFANGVLDYIDLDIDVLVWNDFSFKILDMEDFEYNSVKFKYSKKVIENSKKSLAELLQMIKTREFPFNFAD
jgi:protein associated with RNAse G/E